MIQIILKEKDWQRLVNYLSKRKDVESGAYAIFKTSGSGKSKKLLVSKIMIPKNNDYHKRSSGAVAFKPGFSERAFQQCEKTMSHLLDVHTHPWSINVGFSHIDDHEAKYTKVPYLDKYLPDTMIAFIVFGKSSLVVKARFWDKSKNRLSNIDRIIVI